MGDEKETIMDLDHGSRDKMAESSRVKSEKKGKKKWKDKLTHKKVKGKAKKKRLNADAVIDGLEGSSNSASLSTVPSNTGSGKESTKEGGTANTKIVSKND